MSTFLTMGLRYWADVREQRKHLKTSIRNGEFGVIVINTKRRVTVIVHRLTMCTVPVFCSIFCFLMIVDWLITVLGCVRVCLRGSVFCVCFLSLSFSLCFCRSLSLFVCLCVSLPASVFLCLRLCLSSVCLCLLLSVNLYLHLPLPLPLYLCPSLSLSLRLFLSLSLSISISYFVLFVCFLQTWLKGVLKDAAESDATATKLLSGRTRNKNSKSKKLDSPASPACECAQRIVIRLTVSGMGDGSLCTL